MDSKRRTASSERRRNNPRPMLRLAAVWRVAVAASLTLTGCVSVAPPNATPSQSRWLRDAWDFKFRQFPIGAWLGPDQTDAEVRVYKEAGFNVVMVGRYMAHGTYALPDSIEKELDLAHKHGLAAMLDTYTQDDRPWGGAIPVKEEGHHHAAYPEELRWIHDRFGDHPALIGYMIGDDQGRVDERMAADVAFLRDNAPHLIPWICGWVSPANLAEHMVPFVDHQIYPTLYNRNDTAEQQAASYCATYENHRKQCLRYGLDNWPMFNADGDDVTDSSLRFPIYAAVAYGARGIMYFTYRNYMTRYAEGKPGHDTYEEAIEDVTPLYFAAKEANLQVGEWGEVLYDIIGEGVFSTGYHVPDAGVPGPGRIVTAAADNLLVGILKNERTNAVYAAIVDKRVSKTYNTHPARTVEVSFADCVERIEVLRRGDPETVEGQTVAVSLKGGEGMLVELVPGRGKKAQLLMLARNNKMVADYSPTVKGWPRFFTDTATVEIQSAVEGVGVRYTLDGSEPTESSPLYTGPVSLDDTTTLVAMSWAPGADRHGYRTEVSFVKTKGLDVLAEYTAGREALEIGEGAVKVRSSAGDGPTIPRGPLTVVSGDAPEDLADFEGSLVFHGPGDPGFSHDGVLTEATTGMGLEAWVKPRLGESGGMVAYTGDGSRSGFGLTQAGERWAVLYGGVMVMAGGQVEAGKWTHLMCYRNGDETHLVVDGVDVARPRAAAPHPAKGATTIGAGFSGEIAKVRFFEIP